MSTVMQTYSADEIRRETAMQKSAENRKRRKKEVERS